MTTVEIVLSVIVIIPVIAYIVLKILIYRAKKGMQKEIKIIREEGHELLAKMLEKRLKDAEEFWRNKMESNRTKDLKKKYIEMASNIYNNFKGLKKAIPNLPMPKEIKVKLKQLLVTGLIIADFLTNSDKKHLIKMTEGMEKLLEVLSEVNKIGERYLIND